MNHTIGLGGYQGGPVWVESMEEFPIFRREGLAGGKPKIIKVTGGKEVSGKVYDTHDRLLSFHPRLWHQVQPWTGDRWSLTAYTIRETDILSWEQSKLLMVAWVSNKLEKEVAFRSFPDHWRQRTRT